MRALPEPMWALVVHQPAEDSALILLTVLFVAHLAHIWPQPAACWLCSLGGKLGLPSDLDGLYLLLASISFVFIMVATLSFALSHPFPFSSFTYR